MLSGRGVAAFSNEEPRSYRDFRAASSLRQVSVSLRRAFWLQSSQMVNLKVLPRLTIGSSAITRFLRIFNAARLAFQGRQMAMHPQNLEVVIATHRAASKVHRLARRDKYLPRNVIVRHFVSSPADAVTRDDSAVVFYIYALMPSSVFRCRAYLFRDSLGVISV